MTITALDIKLRQSQRLTDNPDGGGRMVQTEIVDGAMNNLFPDIGDEERTTGRSTLRKLFVHVDTDGTDVLKDAIGVIVNPPTDTHVSMSMFATGSYSDVRADARNRVEAYITKGVESRYVLMGDHFIGQMALSMYCAKDAPTPDINDNLCLATVATGYAADEQYMRVRSILSRTTQTFWDDSGAFERDVIVVETVTALLYNFHGQEVNRLTSIKPPTRIYDTNTVDANSYYSVKRLTVAAAAGDLSVKVDTPYVPIVPATTAETPVVDVLAGLGTLSFVQAGAADALALNFSAEFAAGIAVTRFLGGPMLVGSVKVTAPLAAEAGIAQIMGGEAAELTQGGNKFLFRTSFGQQSSMPKVAKYIHDDMKAKSVAVVWVNNDFGRGGRDVVVKELERLGSKVVADLSTEAGQADFAADVGKIKAANPDAVFAYLNEEESARILKELKRQGVTAPLMGETTLIGQKVIELAGDAANGARGHVGLTTDAPVDLIKAFREKFSKKYNYVPDHNGLKGYLAVYMVKATTEKMGKVDSKAFADTLHGLTIKAADEPGILMDVTFSDTGDIDRQSFLVEVVEGKQVVKQVLPKVK